MARSATDSGVLSPRENDLVGRKTEQQIYNSYLILDM